MIRVEPLRRPPLPDWAIFSIMAGLYLAAGQISRAEFEVIKMMAATRLPHQGEN